MSRHQLSAKDNQSSSRTISKLRIRLVRVIRRKPEPSMASPPPDTAPILRNPVLQQIRYRMLRNNSLSARGMVHLDDPQPDRTFRLDCTGGYICSARVCRAIFRQKIDIPSEGGSGRRNWVIWMRVRFVPLGISGEGTCFCPAGRSESAARTVVS